MKSILDRSKRPESSEEIKFQPPEINEFFLPNGLRVLFVEKHDLPIVQFNLLLDAGSRFDPAGKSGLAYLVASLIDEGAGKFDALQLSEEFEKLGSIFFTSATSDSAYLSLLSLKENFDDSVKLFASVLKEPHLHEEDFERERKKQLSRILQMQTIPSYLAETIFEKKLFQGTPKATPVLGEIETLGNISHEDVLEFHRKFFRNENSVLVVVADLEAEELKRVLEENFESWENPSRIEATTIKFNPPRKKIFLVNKPEAVQSEILMGHLTDKKNSPDYFAKLVFNSIFGGQFSSRLNSNLRESKGYTYGINSSFLYNKDGGYFNISTSVETKNTIPAIEEILKELQKVNEEGVTEAETKYAKSFLTKRFPSQLETYGQVAMNLSMISQFSLPIDYLHTYVQNINQVTVEEVNKIAREKIVPSDLILTVVGDEKELRRKLENLSFFDSVDVIEVSRP